MKKILLTTTLIIFSTILVLGCDDSETNTYSEWRKGEVDGNAVLMAGDINNVSCSVFTQNKKSMFLLSFNSPIIPEQTTIRIGEDEISPRILWFNFREGLGLIYLGDVEYLLFELIAKAEGNNLYVEPHYQDGSYDFITFNFTELLKLADT